jgi:PAS domain S-box-containing protein
VESFIVSAASDLSVKANLLAGQQKIIDYTDFGLTNLLLQEFSIIRSPLKVDALCIVDLQQNLISASGEQKLIEAFQNHSLANNYWDGNPLFISTVSDQIHLWALSPIVRAKTKIGVLGVGLNLDSNFINRIESMNNAAVLLSFRKQTFVSGTIPVTFFNTFVGIARSALDRNMNTERSEGTRYFTSTFTLPGFPELFIHCFLDTGDSRKLLGRYQTFSLGFLLIVIILGFSTSFLLYRFTFLKPFGLFNEAIRSIAAGNLGHSIERTGKDEFGELARAFEDMTKSLRQRDEQLVELARYNSLVLSNVGSGILTISFEGIITAINPAACTLLGLDPSDIGTGRKMGEVDIPGELTQLIHTGLHGESPLSSQEIKVETGGSTRVLSVSVSPFLSQRGGKLGIIVTVADATHERDLERKLEMSSRMATMGEMAAGVAHQIRNPLAIMKVSGELLRDQLARLPDGDQSRKLVSMIVKETDSLGVVVSNFLDFAKPLNVRKAPCGIEEIIRHVVSMIPAASFPGIDIRCLCDGELEPISIDRSLIGQAFTNLVMNALQASSPGQTVHIEAMRSDGGIAVEIRDSGQGMDEATQAKIFNPFFTTKVDGTGLGLAIVHRIMESHGGRIEVQSHPDKGTVFRVIL